MDMSPEKMHERDIDRLAYREIYPGGVDEDTGEEFSSKTNGNRADDHISFTTHEDKKKYHLARPSMLSSGAAK